METKRGLMMAVVLAAGPASAGEYCDRMGPGTSIGEIFGTAVACGCEQQKARGLSCGSDPFDGHEPTPDELYYHTVGLFARFARRGQGQPQGDTSQGSGVRGGGAPAGPSGAPPPSASASGTTGASQATAPASRQMEPAPEVGPSRPVADVRGRPLKSGAPPPQEQSSQDSSQPSDGADARSSWGSTPSDWRDDLNKRIGEEIQGGRYAAGNAYATANSDGSVTIYGKNGDTLKASGGKFYDKDGKVVGTYTDNGNGSSNVYNADGELVGTVKVKPYGNGQQAVLDASWDNDPNNRIIVVY